ncbi:MAG: hypothetical protein ACKO45_11260 [Cyanobium sp.]
MEGTAAFSLDLAIALIETSLIVRLGLCPSIMGLSEGFESIKKIGALSLEEQRQHGL